MRLTEYEIRSIKSSFDKFFETGDIYLFGSRVDDHQKGGDIDLFINTKDTVDLLDKKIAFLIDLKSKIDEQKIDLIISSDKSKPIEKEALTKGIKLDINQIKQDKVINECDKHLKRLNYASNQLKKVFPLTEKSYENLSEDNIQDIDQLLYRFSKLQDTIGEKLLKITISLYEENIEQFTFIDILNKLEKRDILLTQDWKMLRGIRNELSHNYDDNPYESSILLNKVYSKQDILIAIYENLKSRIRQLK